MAFKPCNEPGCGALTRQRYCDKHQRDSRRAKDERRGSASARGYDWRWQKARAAFLARPENALCVMCKAQNILTPATVVDHIVAHKGDEKLFWDEANWQPLCKPHHDRDKQIIEKGGRVQGSDAASLPVDHNYPWSRA